MVLRVARTGAVRPTAANARQVLFDILGGRVAGTRWLDLYAGSGAVGLEALSRGATGCLMVESARRCVETIRDNIARLGYKDLCRLFSFPVEKALKKLAADGQAFDVIFLDPPYAGEEGKRCLLAIGRSPALLAAQSPEGLVVAQLSVHTEVLPAYGALVLERERRFGDTRLCFFRPSHPPTDASIPEPPSGPTE